MIQFGNDKIKEIYVGSDKIKEVYHGADLVWTGKKASYAILTDGTRVDFEEENTPIENFKYSFANSYFIVNGNTYNHISFKEIYFGSSYKDTLDIPGNFLRNTSNLVHVDLSVFTQVAKIGAYFLLNNSKIELIDLSSLTNISNIGMGFLSSCTSLATLFVGSITVPITNSSSFINRAPLKHIYVPCESVQAYKTTSPWSNFANIISCPATKAPRVLFKANEVNVGFKHFRGDGGYNITNAGIELSIANETFTAVGTSLAYDVSEYSGIRVKYIQESNSIDNATASIIFGISNDSTGLTNSMYARYSSGLSQSFERVLMFDDPFITKDGVVNSMSAYLFFQYQEAYLKPNSKITITEIEMI